MIGGSVGFAVGRLIDQALGIDCDPTRNLVQGPFLEGSTKGDDPGFAGEEERRRAIEKAQEDATDPNKSQAERSKARRRLRELLRRKSKRAHGADK